MHIFKSIFNGRVAHYGMYLYIKERPLPDVVIVLPWQIAVGLAGFYEVRRGFSHYLDGVVGGMFDMLSVPGGPTSHDTQLG